MNFLNLLRKAVKYPANKANEMVKRTNWYQNVIPDLDNFPTNDWYRKHLERNFEIAIVGSSSGVFGFDLSVAPGLKAFNWCLQPMAMEYAYRVLQNFFSILKKDGIVAIVFSPFSGLQALGKQGKTTDDRFYHLLDGTLIENFEEVARRRRYPYFYNPKQAIKHMLKDEPPRPKKATLRQLSTSEEYERDADNWIRMWMREFTISDLNAPLTEQNMEGSKARAAVIQQMVDFCLERDLRPIFVTPPCHPALARKFTPEFRKNYIKDFLEPFIQQGIPFYDYLEHPDFTDDSLFANAYFLSPTGAQAFTRHFLKALSLL